MKRFIICSVMLIMALHMTGCTGADARLNGTWRGKFHVGGSTGTFVWVFTFNEGQGFLGIEGMSSKTRFTYETKTKPGGPNEFILWDEDGYAVLGIYKFPTMEGNTLLFSDFYEGVRPDPDSLQTNIGPVFYLTKDPGSKTLKDALVSTASEWIADTWQMLQ